MRDLAWPVSLCWAAVNAYSTHTEAVVTGITPNQPATLVV